MRSVHAAILALVLLTTACESDKNEDQSGNNENNGGVQSSGGPGSGTNHVDEFGRAIIPEDCVGKSLEFTHDIILEEHRSRMNGVGGYGNVNVPTHVIPTGHTATGMANREDRTPLYLPTTANLFNLQFAAHDGGGVNGAMYFKICGDVGIGGISFHFGHLSELAPELAESLGCESVTSCKWGTGAEVQSDPVEIQAGTLIAYVGGPNRDPGAGFDLGVLDINQAVDLPGGFAVWGTLGHAACPYTYFVNSEVRTFWLDLLKSDSKREPICGTTQLYVEGTLQGVWFDPATPWPTDGQNEYKHISFGPTVRSENRDFLMNATVNVAGGAYYVTRSSGRVNRPASQMVSDGSKYCIEGGYNHPQTISEADRVSGIFVLEMKSDTVLTVEHLDSESCPDDVDAVEFSTNAKTFERFKADWNFTAGF